MNNRIVTAVGGPSGVGKSKLSYPLAKRFDIPIVEVDDLFHAVEALTTPQSQPLIHFWTEHPEALQHSAAEILEKHIEICRALAPAIDAVIDNHIRTKMPIVLEGDYLLPELVTQWTDKVRAIFLYEEDINQLSDNLLAREPEQGRQEKRAEVSVLFGNWLRDECARLGFNAIPARPWKTVVERVVSAVA